MYQKIIMHNIMKFHASAEPYVSFLQGGTPPLKEVTSSAIVVLTSFLDSPNLPKEDLSGLKGKFSWHDAQIW